MLGYCLKGFFVLLRWIGLRLVSGTFCNWWQGEDSREGHFQKASIARSSRSTWLLPVLIRFFIYRSILKGSGDLAYRVMIRVADSHMYL